jgi:hypothetical protein
LHEAAHMRVAIGDQDGKNNLHADVQSNSCTKPPACSERAVSS